MAANVHRIHQNRDEGQSGDEKALALADVRGEILNQITGPHGNVVWAKARDIGRSAIPALAAATVVNFATGQSKTPTYWTIKPLTEYVKGRRPMKMWLIQADFAPPLGVVAVQVQ